MKKHKKDQFFVIPFQLKVDKPWGYELILTPPDAPFTGKLLHLDKDCRFSFQYHDKKQESLTLVKGRAKLWLEDENGKIRKIEMKPFKGYLIKPYQKHRACGITDCDILETSTPERGKTVRLQDDYARGTETEKEREKRRRPGVYRD